MEEHLQRVEQEAFHVRPRRAHLVGMVHEDPGRVVVQQLVGLLVQLLALSLVRGAAGAKRQTVERRILEARRACGPPPAFSAAPYLDVPPENNPASFPPRPTIDCQTMPPLV